MLEIRLGRDRRDTSPRRLCGRWKTLHDPPGRLASSTVPFICYAARRVCFVELGDGFYLELIAPLDDKARLTSFFKVGFYHLCFLVDDLDAARAHLTARRFTELPAFASEAFAGNLCQFFVSPQSHLIELAQMSKTEFADFFSANLRS